MIQRNTMCLSLRQPIEIFSAGGRVHLKTLLDALGLEKGAYGPRVEDSEHELYDGLDYPRVDVEFFSNDFLLERRLGQTGANSLRVVGALAQRYVDCQDFAIFVSETRLLAKVDTLVDRGLARHLMRVDPQKVREVNLYKIDVFKRCYQRPK